MEEFELVNVKSFEDAVKVTLLYELGAKVLDLMFKEAHLGIAPDWNGAEVKAYGNVVNIIDEMLDAIGEN